MRSTHDLPPAVQEGLVLSACQANKQLMCPLGEPPKEHVSKSPKAQRIAHLRRIVAGIETATLAGSPAFLPLDMQEVHRSLSGPGLACGVLHEVDAVAHGDRPAAFGFLVALMARALQDRPGAAVLVASRRGLADFGDPYGHGLRQLGLDVGRFLLVETRTAKEALWALEEVLRSQVMPAMVCGAVESALDLTSSRRLNLAAAAHGTPLLLLRGAKVAGTSGAATRWCIGTAPASRDAFGGVSRWRWTVALERCRNGRPGQWLFEWDHVAHRFRLVEGMADRALPARPGLRRAG